MSSSSKVCLICGDFGSGKHYGAIQACNGCKGFFRRCIKSKRFFIHEVCRFNNNCNVALGSRRECRSCRYRKCIQFGMKPEAVKKEGFELSLVKLDNPELLCAKTITTSSLVLADALAKSKVQGVETSLSDMNTVVSWGRVAGIEEMGSGMCMELANLVEWAKHLPGFKGSLCLEDQLGLLRSHAGEYIVLQMARRSLGVKDHIVYANGFLLPRNAKDLFGNVPSVRCRIMDELVEPLGELGVDEVELGCLKALVFLDPNVPGLQDVGRVKALRNQVQTILEDHVNNKKEKGGKFQRRVTGLLLTLPALQSICWQMVEKIRLGMPQGLKWKKLIGEMLFGESVTKPEVKVQINPGIVWE